MWASAQRRLLASVTYLEQFRKFSSFMLHADSRRQSQINVCEKKEGAHMQSSNHAPQHGINTLSGKATMMKKERKPGYPLKAGQLGVGQVR